MTDSQPPKEPKEAWQIEADQRTKELTDKLESGMKDLFSSDKYKNYLKSMSHFHNYSSRNIMLIHQQMPNATRVASFKLWKEQFNRSVIKGETSIRIFAPIGTKKPETKLFEKIDPETKSPMLDKDGNIIMEELTELTKGVKFRLVPVFDVSQTHGEPLPMLIEDLTGNVSHYEAFLDTLKAVSPLPITFESMEPEQDGYCLYGEKIAIREDMSEPQTVSAIIHEITHARLHEKNNLPDGEKPKSKEVKEIEAESVSYVVCQKFGIETGANSFGYLATWGSHDMAEIKASLDIIRSEANQIINAIDDRFAVICKERGIDLSQAEQAAQPPTPEKPQAIEFTTEVHTENIAGVDFSFEEVKPVAENKAIMPDSTISIADQHAYGYISDEILPLNQNRAVDLFMKDHTIFLLFNDGTEEMAFDSSEITAHNGIFGIERDEWLNSNEYQATHAEEREESTEPEPLQEPKKTADTKEKPSLLDSLKQNEQKSKQQFQKSVHDKDTPQKSNKKLEGEL
ncbi:MAG: ArdC-like ssDNA-binding domain-containing protein [Defluviitaleaceae bacterium]|nr:ArdC-like ssDNA-binding domain-containing protein [Defluviitaleaceae bacterium]